MPPTDTEEWNMAAWWPFWKWHRWKSIGFFPYTQVMCQWSVDLIFKSKLKLDSGNHKIQYGCQAAILKLTSLKINKLLSITTKNKHIKFEIEIPNQPWVTLRKPCHLQTEGRTKWIHYTPPPSPPPPTTTKTTTTNLFGWCIKNVQMFKFSFFRLSLKSQKPMFKIYFLDVFHRVQ